MGCDIHAAIEVNDGQGWKALTFPNPYAGKWEDEPPTTPRLDMNRNYCAFAILADVRNGVGFAGCDTGDGFIPIAPGRGLPGDITPEARDNGCTGDHSDTYVTADELLAYDWTRMTKRRGWVNAITFEAWDRMKEWQPRPEEWSGGVMGASVDHVSIEEMRRRVKEVMGEKRGVEWSKALELLKARYANTYCLIEWEEPYTEAAGDLWTKVVPLVMKLKTQHRDVRLVMNFDS